MGSILSRCVLSLAEPRYCPGALLYVMCAITLKIMAISLRHRLGEGGNQPGEACSRRAIAMSLKQVLGFSILLIMECRINKIATCESMVILLLDV